MATVKVTSADFDDVVLRSSRLVLVDFWASWCAPCRSLAPILEDVAEDFADSVLVAKIDTEENPDVAESFAVSALPTMLFFMDGELVERIAGVQTRSKIGKMIEGLL